MPKKNYERKLHPTYETSIRIKNGGQQTSPHYVVKFYDQYKDLCDGLKELGVGDGLPISIDATFPLKYPKSYVGFTLTEQQLQHRCYMLNKWMGAIFANYHAFPTKAQLLISEFLSLNDNDAELEQNKELILALLRRKKENLLTEGIISNTRTGVPSANGNSSISSIPNSLVSSTGNNSPIRLTSEALSDNNNQLQGKGNNTAIDTSVYDTNNPGLLPSTENDVKSFARETVVGGFLGVTVKKGSQLVRKKDDSKLHHSYETFMRLLPLPEVVYTQGKGKAEIDPDVYAEQVANTQLKVVLAFDSYRELKNDLERVHVYSSDNPTDSSVARQNGYKVIVIDAPFPPTLKKSALGVSLTEAQVEQRAAMMNNWMGILLKNFNVLPRDGKELMTDFLGMPSVYSDQAATTPQYTIIHNILRGQYVPPKLANGGSSSPKSPHSPKKTLVSFFKRSSTAESLPRPASVNTTTTATNSNNTTTNNTNNNGVSQNTPFSNNNTAVVMTDNHSFDNKSNLGSSHPATRNKIDSDNVSVFSGNDVMTDAGLDATSSEVLVGQYLGFCVIRGKPVAKKVGEKPSHPSYEILMRILPLEETILPEGEKRMIDEVVFNKYVEAGPVRLAFAFDAYRGLKSELEAFRVYSLDRKSEVDAMLAKNPNDPVVLIDARFPRTYQRQSLGLKLNDPQLNQRAVMLNQWFGALMQSFHLLPFAAKDRVINFLSAVNTATLAQGVGLQPLQNPRDAAILAMLRGTYVPELKKVSHSIFTHNNNNTGADGTSGKKSKKNKKSKGGAEGEDGVVDMAQCGPGCVVM
eukprot:gene8724-10322_t